MVKEPDTGILFIFLKRNCKERKRGGRVSVVVIGETVGESDQGGMWIVLEYASD
jgi:hypothetical protein